MPGEFIQVVTTTATADDARRIARTLVEQRLAACVQIVGPIESVYRWEGQTESAAEWQCWIKARHAQFVPLEKAIREVHPYKVPEILAIQVVAGSEPYLKWLREETQ